jgi:hypothetical protein
MGFIRYIFGRRGASLPETKRVSAEAALGVSVSKVLHEAGSRIYV